MSSQIDITLQENDTPITVVNSFRDDAVLSVRNRGDDVPHTGDVILANASICEFEPNIKYLINEFITYNGHMWRSKSTHWEGDEINTDNWDDLGDIADFWHTGEADHRFVRYKLDNNQEECMIVIHESGETVEPLTDTRIIDLVLGDIVS